MTFSYDKKTQQSYNNILEERTYRTAQPKVPFPDLGEKCFDSAETSDISSPRRCRKFPFRMFPYYKQD